MVLEGSFVKESSPVEAGAKEGVAAVFVYVLRNGELRESLADGLHFLCMLGGESICAGRSRIRELG